MSVEEWKDESNAISAGEITLPSKEEIEKRTEAMTEGQAAAIAIMQDLQEKRRAFKEHLNKEDVPLPNVSLVRPVYFCQLVEMGTKVIPIKRKLNRYSKQYIKKLFIKAGVLSGPVDTENKE